MSIKKDYLVKKRNVLNEIRANNMTLQELRFFSIYLSKINPKDINTRAVRFSLNDFQSIMELGSRIKVDYLKSVTNSLLCKVVNVPDEYGGYTGFQLFKECKVSMDKNNEWYVEIDAHDKALPLMFEFKERYFTYQLWNALRLRSSNQLRMYEILKQYEKIGERIISVADLRDYLGIGKDEYPRFENFKTRVLDACRWALEEHTDIKFTYEPHGKKGNGGKILFLKFKISKNENYIDQLTLDEFIDQQSEAVIVEEDKGLLYKNESIRFIAEACNFEFSETEMLVLYDLAVQLFPYKNKIELDMFDYLHRKYDELNMRAEKTKITNRFAYFKKMIESDIKK